MHALQKSWFLRPQHGFESLVAVRPPPLNDNVDRRWALLVVVFTRNVERDDEGSHIPVRTNAPRRTCRRLLLVVHGGCQASIPAHATRSGLLNARLEDQTHGGAVDCARARVCVCYRYGSVVYIILMTDLDTVASKCSHRRYLGMHVGTIGTGKMQQPCCGSAGNLCDLLRLVNAFNGARKRRHTPETTTATGPKPLTTADANACCDSARELATLLKLLKPYDQLLLGQGHHWWYQQMQHPCCDMAADLCDLLLYVNALNQTRLRRHTPVTAAATQHEPLTTAEANACCTSAYELHTLMKLLYCHIYKYKQQLFGHQNPTVTAAGQGGCQPGRHPLGCPQAIAAGRRVRIGDLIITMKTLLPASRQPEVDAHVAQFFSSFMRCSAADFGIHHGKLITGLQVLVGRDAYNVAVGYAAARQRVLNSMRRDNKMHVTPAANTRILPAHCAAKLGFAAWGSDPTAAPEPRGSKRAAAPPDEANDRPQPETAKATDAAHTLATLRAAHTLATLRDDGKRRRTR